MKERAGCMPTFIFGGLTVLLVLSFLSLAMRSDDTRYTTTVERVIQPAASVQLEAQQLAAQTERARMDAERTAQRDFYVFVGALTFAGMIVLLLFVWLFTRRPQILEQHVTLQLPPDTQPDRYIDVAWHIIDERKIASGYQLEERK